ncbi:MAG TPA: flotillin-like FloA family protein, partial [Tepidisphaeraceae bacterium]|nr:flotillin-like FloA family protein [Tepidisphaeraceae bacterium]
EQENVAKQAENRAQVVLAEADVPKAIADAFRSGNLGVMDYYRLRNIQADTTMRESIARPGDGTKS